MLLTLSLSLRAGPLLRQLEKRWEGLVGVCQLPSCAFQEGMLSQEDQYRTLVFKDIQTAVYILGSLYTEEPLSLDIYGRLLEGQVWNAG